MTEWQEMNDLVVLEAQPTEQIGGLTPYNLEVFIDRLLESLDRNPRTVQAYKRGVRYFLEWTQDQGINYPTRSDIKLYKDHLMESHQVSTVANYIAAVRWLYKAISEETGKPELNIAAGIRVPKPPKNHQRDALTEDQVRHMLASMPNETLTQKRDRAIAYMTYYLALRTIEVSRADVGDIRNTSRGTEMAIWGKARDGKSERLPVHLNALNVLNDYLEARKAAYGTLKDNDPMFICLSRNNYGQRITSRSVSQILKSNIQEYVMDNPRLTAHSLRHAAINTLHNQGASLYEMQQFARHKNPATTEIYIHENEATLWDASNRLGDALTL